MKSVRFISVVSVMVAVLATFAFPQQRLVLMGGGDRPPESLARFIEWAGGKEKARILVVTWASGVPVESFDSIREDFSKYPVQTFEHAPMTPIDDLRKKEFLEKLKTATGVFFSGGDQNRIMDVLKDDEMYNALRAKYDAGAVFGGTSAGTALMSTPMMTGENDLKVIDASKVGTRKGLGLLPDSIIDQHFIVRQRENRLFGLVMGNPKLLGVGIDEDNALLVADNRIAEVVGPTYVMFVDGSNKKATFVIDLVKNGGKFDLKKRKVIR